MSRWYLYVWNWKYCPFVHFVSKLSRWYVFTEGKRFMY